jgi:hypothetical protein
MPNRASSTALLTIVLLLPFWQPISAQTGPPAAPTNVRILKAAVTDSTPPTVSISAPASGATVSGTVTLTASAADNVGVAAVHFNVDGVNLGGELLTPPYQASWNTSLTLNGPHTLTAVARDAAGNATTSAGVNVTVANQASTATPVLLFTDLISGPSTGNSDNSRSGQIAGQDGAIVTVWGKNLGTTAGTITVGGIQARIYSWGNATAPADLFSKHRMQMVAFQVPHGLANGATTIQANVGGVNTNTLPFTIRAGNIYYVKTTGNDTSGNGSWSNPWRKISTAVGRLAPGDTVYATDGVQQTTQDGDRSTMNLEYGMSGSQLATRAMPKAVIAYPNANVLIGNTAYGAGWSIYVGGSSPDAANWVFSKFNLTAQNEPGIYGPGFRMIGNRLTAPLGDGATGGMAGGDSSNIFILGNELTQIGHSGTSKLYHPMYIQSLESSSGTRLPEEPNREIGWNYLHDNFAYDGINIYREGSSSAFMTHTTIHDNFIINQTGRGMLIGFYTVGPDNYIYNNVIIRAGQGPASQYTTDPAFGYVCVDFQAGWSAYPGTTIVHFYNNTLYGCGFTDTANGISGGMIGYANNQPFTLDFRNNIIQSTGFPYVGGMSDPFPANQGSRNIWFGQGNAPSLDSSPINADPRLVSPSTGDVHLQSTSPGINAGSSAAPAAAVDFDNNVRPQGAGYDIGAYEFVSGGQTPTSSPAPGINADSQAIDSSSSTALLPAPQRSAVSRQPR